MSHFHINRTWNCTVSIKHVWSERTLSTDWPQWGHHPSETKRNKGISPTHIALHWWGPLMHKYCVCMKNDFSSLLWKLRQNGLPYLLCTLCCSSSLISRSQLCRRSPAPAPWHQTLTPAWHPPPGKHTHTTIYCHIFYRTFTWRNISLYSVRHTS